MSLSYFFNISKDGNFLDTCWYARFYLNIINNTGAYMLDSILISKLLWNCVFCRVNAMILRYSWPSRAWKKILLVFLSTFWHSCSKCILMCFKKDRGRCQVWKHPKLPELGQRSTECKFLYIRQNLEYLSISYPKLWLKVMQNLFWIIQPCYINKQHHQGMMCVWIKGHLSAKSVNIVAIFYVCRDKAPILSSLLP